MADAIRAHGLDPDSAAYTRFADMRYAGQSSELRVRMPDGHWMTVPWQSFEPPSTVNTTAPTGIGVTTSASNWSTCGYAGSALSLAAGTRTTVRSARAARPAEQRIRLPAPGAPTSER